MTVKKQLSIEFLGAAKTVTGSRILVKYNGYQFLIDCGLFQGPKQIRIKNWEDFIDADKIHSVILTHAHIDHSGYLPKFVKEGFRGKVFASAGTVDLCKILLTDSAHLQEEDAKYLNKKRATHFHPAKPLYTVEDAEQAISLLVPVSKDEWHELTEGISFRLLRSGHILGSTFVQLSYTTGNGQKIITFSGDIGHDRQNVIKGPVIIKESDVLILEGTYGDRVQSKVDAADELEPIIKSTLNRGGVVVIPAFAVGRAQEILFLISKLEREKRIPSVPVYLDSPMSINATDIYMKYRDELRLTFNGDHFDYPLCPQQFQAVRSVDESMLVTMQDGPFIVVSAAGMLTGGRILHHLRKRLPEAKNSVIFVGFQVEETKGRLLQQGLPKIRIHKQLIDVEAEIHSISSLSAHGDSNDIIDWVRRFNKKPSIIYLNHGEPAALNALKYRLETELGLKVEVPDQGGKYIIE